MNDRESGERGSGISVLPARYDDDDDDDIYSDGMILVEVWSVKSMPIIKTLGEATSFYL